MKTVALALTAALMTLGALPAAAARAHRWNDHRNDHRNNHRNDWRNLGALQTSGIDDTLVVDRRVGRIDDLRIEATRGLVNLRNVVLTTTDGRRYVVAVNQQLRQGNAQFVDVPGPAQRLASVELQYTGGRVGFWRRAFGGNRADVVMFAR
jgi:hypothetical protein